VKSRTILTLALVLLGTGLCARLGFWQVSRWHEKRALNAAMEAALASPPLAVGDRLPPPAAVLNRKIELRGRFDEMRQLLLAGRVRAQLPGVEVVTPLLLAGDSAAILVNRGWLYAPDAMHADPQEFPEPGLRAVVGVAEPIGRGTARFPMVSMGAGGIALWSTRVLDLDSVRMRLPYPIAPFILAELPGTGVPEKPVRGTPPPLDASMHLNYAIQWFLFGAILLGGSAALAWSRRRRSAPGAGPH
jgi:surfeit locus 1 family protein